MEIKTKKSKYNFSEIPVGEKIQFKETQGRISSACCMFVKRHNLDWKFKIEKADVGYYVTRIS
jgi:hypothetical protein